ncbi:MAG: hypothetical protein NTV93_07530 [Verrucomicrobia bacterium]|nr:hypothetical protein [Verrucomicrobiota bacterium]
MESAIGVAEVAGLFDKSPALLTFGRKILVAFPPKPALESSSDPAAISPWKSLRISSAAASAKYSAWVAAVLLCTIFRLISDREKNARTKPDIKTRKSRIRTRAIPSAL